MCEASDARSTSKEVAEEAKLAVMKHFKPMKKFFAVLMLIGAAFAFQGDDPKPVPECKGEGCRDDVTHQMHPGSPAWCQNKDGKGCPMT